MLKPIRNALKRLVGKPFWGSWGALDLQFFEFGEKCLRLNRRDEKVEYGDYALLLSCAWKLGGPLGVVTCSKDRDEEPSPVYPICNDYAIDRPFDNLKSQRLWYYLQFALSDLIVVRHVRVESDGGFVVLMSGGHTLSVELVDTAGEDIGQWAIVKDAPHGPTLLTVQACGIRRSGDNRPMR